MENAVKTRLQSVQFAEAQIYKNITPIWNGGPNNSRKMANRSRCDAPPHKARQTTS